MPKRKDTSNVKVSGFSKYLEAKRNGLSDADAARASSGRPPQRSRRVPRAWLFRVFASRCCTMLLVVLGVAWLCAATVLYHRFVLDEYCGEPVCAGRNATAAAVHTLARVVASSTRKRGRAGTTPSSSSPTAAEGNGLMTAAAPRRAQAGRRARVARADRAFRRDPADRARVPRRLPV